MLVTSFLSQEKVFGRHYHQEINVLFIDENVMHMQKVWK